jgi:hypothetical protein
LARVVTDRLTPTRPILENRLVVGEALMWAATAADVVRSIGHWLNPMPGRSWRDVLHLYHSRARRLGWGRVSWLGRDRP